jgi:hypothetical protein
LLQAVSDVHVCALKVAQLGESRSVHACVFNASKEPKKSLGIRVRGLDAVELDENPSGAPPNVVAEATIAVPGEVPPDTGVAVTGDFDLNGTRPLTFEAFADRIDLLPR